MVLVTEQECDDTGCTGCSGGGGHLASVTQHVDATTTRVTEYQYDWRGRQEYVIPPADDQGRTVYTRQHFDNLDQVIKVERYHEQSPSADILISRQETFLDDLGRTYETRRYAVNPTTGSVGNYLAGYTWYDAAGNVIKQQAEGRRSFSKTFYDGLGRPTKQFVGYDLSEEPGCTTSSSSSSSSSGEPEGHTAATNVEGDTILEQTETDFDDAGNTIFVTTRQRFHNATGTGELTTPSGDQPKARVSYVGSGRDSHIFSECLMASGRKRCLVGRGRRRVVPKPPILKRRSGRACSDSDDSVCAKVMIASRACFW
jgi:hypothetical protein